MTDDLELYSAAVENYLQLKVLTNQAFDKTLEIHNRLCTRETQCDNCNKQLDSWNSIYKLTGTSIDGCEYCLTHTIEKGGNHFLFCISCGCNECKDCNKITLVSQRGIYRCCKDWRKHRNYKTWCHNTECKSRV